MSQLVGSELTFELFDRLKGEAVNVHEGKVIVIATVDEQGWAHPAMLSYYEIVAKDREHIDVATGRTSTTGKNLRRTGKITLIVTDKGVNYYIKGEARELQEQLAGVPFMSLFRVTVKHLLEDQEPGAEMTGGITFSRPEKREVSEIIEKVFRGVKEAR